MATNNEDLLKINKSIEKDEDILFPVQKNKNKKKDSQENLNDHKSR